MGDYRSYLNQQKNVKGIQKKRRHRYLGKILVLALVVYLGVFSSFSSNTLEEVLEENVETIETSGKNPDIQNRLFDLVDHLSKNIYNEKELPIYYVDIDKKQIALSFDAAWGAEDFEEIMKILDKHEVKVTFFMTGEWVSKNPKCVKELVKKGHDLGNHGEHHYDMTTISKEEMKEEIKKVHDSVKEIADYDMNLFRPPYGAYNDEVIETVKEMEYYPIQWSVDSLDWKDYGIDSIISTVCNHEALDNGAIILCHNGAKYTAKALDEMITNLKKQGYELVPISKLIIKDNYHIDVTGKQIADEKSNQKESIKSSEN